MSNVKRYGFPWLECDATDEAYMQENGMTELKDGGFVLWADYVALERRHQDLLDAIERTGGLDNIRRVEVSQPVVIDMARENAFMKGIIMRLTEAGDAFVKLLKDEGYATEPDEDGYCLYEIKAWNAAKSDNL